MRCFGCQGIHLLGVWVHVELFYNFGIRDVYTSVAHQLDRVLSLKQSWDPGIWFHFIDADCLRSSNLWEERNVMSPFLVSEFCCTISSFCLGPMGKLGFLSVRVVSGLGDFNCGLIEIILVGFPSSYYF